MSPFFETFTTHFESCYKDWAHCKTVLVGFGKVYPRNVTNAWETQNVVEQVVSYHRTCINPCLKSDSENISLIPLRVMTFVTFACQFKKRGKSSCKIECHICFRDCGKEPVSTCFLKLSSCVRKWNESRLRWVFTLCCSGLEKHSKSKASLWEKYTWL